MENVSNLQHKYTKISLIEGVGCVILIFRWGILTNFVLLSTSVRIEFEMEQIYADRHSRHKVVTVIFIIIIMIIIVISIIVIIALKNR